MGRSAWLAIGAIARRARVEPLGTNIVGAVVALATAALLVFGEIGPRRIARRAWPVVVGAGLIAARLAVIAGRSAGPGITTRGQRSVDVRRPGHRFAARGPADGHARDTCRGRDRRSGRRGDAPAVPGRHPRRSTSDRRVDPAPARVAVRGVPGQDRRRRARSRRDRSRSCPCPADPGRHLEALRRAAADALAGVLPSQRPASRRASSSGFATGSIAMSRRRSRRPA